MNSLSIVKFFKYIVYNEKSYFKKILNQNKHFEKIIFSELSSILYI